jgi:hypothetical protein
MAKNTFTEAPKVEKTHVAVHPIRHDGKYFPRHALIALGEKDAERLEGLGSARKIADPPAQPTVVDPAVEG